MEEVGLANGTFLGGVGTRPHPPIECTPPEEEEAEDELHPPSEGRGLGGREGASLEGYEGSLSTRPLPASDAHVRKSKR